MRKDTQTKDFLIDYFISIFIHIFLVIAISLMIVAFFDRNTTGEASTGAFETKEFNEDWILCVDGEKQEVSLPTRVKDYNDNLVSITNTLPDDISSHMSLMIRGSLQDVYVYVDGQLRESYASEKLDTKSYYLPSAYVVTKLDAQDASKEITIELRMKSMNQINEVTIGYGNDVWYSVVKNSLPVTVAAIMVLVFGIVLVIAVSIIKSQIKNSMATRYLGFLMIDVSLWVLSESAIRQLIFQRPSLSEIFAYLTVELIGGFVCMYFDEVQHKKYHKILRVLECIVIIQLLVNLSLHFTGICHLFKTLIISHIWSAIGILVIIVTIIMDCLDREIKKYRITAVGMACFLFMAIGELFAFYISRQRVFGTFMCVGLILLMMFTIIQALLDEVSANKEREKKQLRMVNNTIETIAGSIDAKDEYTGGHSERVGKYAERLAREIAADYGFSEDDILRIRYIGLVHDIGKIGVADTVLNKAGRLTDEEFSLMKKHTEIGYEIMGATGESMEGLLDGIRYHHERFDGRGYPDGLSDTQIPLEARILALADSYDAMTSNRVYRKRLTDEEVRNEFLKCAGSQFDPALTKAFVRLIDKGELRVNTTDGMSVDEKGEVLLSAKLENKLHDDLQNRQDILNPAHVRMMCYVIKLMEKKNKKAQVVFYGPIKEPQLSNEEWEERLKALNNLVKGYMSAQDMVIRYHGECNAVALFDKSDCIEKMMDEMKKLSFATNLEILN